MLSILEVRTEFDSLLELSLLADVINTPDSPLQIRNIGGLGPVKANINTTPYGSFTGESYNGSSVGKRNIVISIGFNPNWVGQTIESLRALLYQYFMPESFVNLRFLSSHLPTVEINGYIESMEPNIFSKDPEVQISIICPEPDFVSVTAVTVDGVTNTDTSDVTIINYAGSIPGGFKLTIGYDTDHPFYDQGDFAVRIVAPQDSSLNFSGTLNLHPVIKHIELSTIPGNKYINEIIGASGSNTETIIQSITDDSVWPKLKPGANSFVVVTDEAGFPWTLVYFSRFGGI